MKRRLIYLAPDSASGHAAAAGTGLPPAWWVLPAAVVGLVIWLAAVGALLAML